MKKQGEPEDLPEIMFGLNKIYNVNKKNYISGTCVFYAFHNQGANIGYDCFVR